MGYNLMKFKASFEDLSIGGVADKNNQADATSMKIGVRLNPCDRELI